MKINFANVGEAILGIVMAGIGLCTATKGIVDTIAVFEDGFMKAGTESATDNEEEMVEFEEVEPEETDLEG